LPGAKARQPNGKRRRGERLVEICDTSTVETDAGAALEERRLRLAATGNGQARVEIRTRSCDAGGPSSGIRNLPMGSVCYTKHDRETARDTKTHGSVSAGLRLDADDAPNGSQKTGAGP
jgi:hypothetical protein